MPIGIQDFATIRQDGYVYADKTEIVYKLANLGKSYFFSRPRRFGKSLLVSTLEYYFSGRKDLFQGLAIEKYEKEWIEYPVLKFSFAGGDFDTKDGLEEALRACLVDFEKKYSLPSDEINLAVRFACALKNAVAKTEKRVVVLIDEYDNPLLKSRELEEYNRKIFKSFFAVLKDCDAYTRFVFFTGVTKFSKVSIFSDLNQLQDISLDSKYSALCGITQTELEANFQYEIAEMAKANALSYDDCLAKLKRFYDGYHFCENCEDIYNPFSLINAFSTKKFGKYWFSTGTPTFLVHKLNEQGFNPKEITDGSLFTTTDEISDYRPDNPDIIPLLYQSGYLTFKSYDEDLDSFVLGFPNEEVKYGFMTSLSQTYFNADSPLDIRSFVIDIRNADTNSLKERFISLFARLPYSSVSQEKKDVVIEQNFQNVIYIVFLLLGQFVQVEQHSAKGRADCVVETKNSVYIFEFKRDSSAEEALKQIEEKGYDSPYSADSRAIYKIGVNFNSEKCNIDGWLVK